MTFDEGMNARCDKCGYKAAHHRMTKTTFYCLKLNGTGRMKFYRNKDIDLDLVVYRCKVRFLEHSSLPGAAVKAITQGLRAMDTSAIADTLST